MKIILEAGSQISLVGPGGFIDIGPSGVTIQGTMVNINSGGSAGSGKGCKPKKPKKARRPTSQTRYGSRLQVGLEVHATIGTAVNLHLKFINGPEQGRTLELPLGIVTIGRSREADIVVYWDGLVSSRHLQIDNQPQQCHLMDVGSRNGTRVNEQPIQSVVLQAGDEIQLGETRLLVESQVAVGDVYAPASPGHAQTSDRLREPASSSPSKARSASLLPSPLVSTRRSHLRATDF